MRATILHNPRCSKSRDELARLYARAELATRDALRKDAPAVADDDAALDLMVADPRTIERPLVETDKGVRLARPPVAIRDLL